MPGVITQKTVTVPKRTDKGFGTSPLKSTEFMPTAEKPSVPGIMSQLKNTYKAVSSIPSLYVYQIAHDNDTINTQEKLEETFGALGDMTEAYFLVSPQTCSGEDLSAIVKFSTWTDAEKAFDAMVLSSDTNGNRRCCVKYAKPRISGEGEPAISPKRLFVGQVSESICEQHLQSYFEQFGTIVDLSLLKSKEKGYAARCAFIEYDTWAACDAAIKESDGKVVLATITGDDDDENAVPSYKSLVVRYAKSKSISVHCYPGMDVATDMMAGSPNSYWTAPHYMPIVLHDPHMYHPFFFTPYYHPMVYPTSDGTRVDTDSRKIFVGQLPRRVIENDLFNIFGAFGAIESVSILRSDSGRSQGCGFVTFFTRQDATLAVQEMHGVPYLSNTKPMVVRFASRRHHSASDSS